MQDKQDKLDDASLQKPAQTGSTDESIGRPDNWREGRYQRDGARVDQSVNQPSQSAPKPPPAEQQKPVTLQDYEK